MKRLLNRKNLEIVIILILGLIPLLWFHADEIILGHDAGLTLSPVSHFLDRLFLWTHRYGIGNDQTYALPGFFIHGLEALISWFGLDLQANQKLTFIFWFVLPGLTMYFFATSLENRLGIKYMALPAAVFYMINHYLLQGWFIAERTKFSLYAALPIFLLLLFDWFEGKRSTFRTAIFISLTFFFFNGLASLPLFGGVIVSGLAFVFIFYIIDFSIAKWIKLAKLFVYTLLLSIGLHAFWLLSYIYYVKSSYQHAVSQAGGVSGVLGWIDYISRDTSLSNLLRLQGIPEWYQNPSHPYANEFLTNPLFILISFLIPFAAFSSLFFINALRKKEYILFFNFLAFFSMIFVAGSHPPFGTFYELLVRYVPGFLAFRTPFYKFAPALWLSYSILIAYTFSSLLNRKFVMKYSGVYFIFIIFYVASVLAYNYPFLNGMFFEYVPGERSMRTYVPQYVYDFRSWSEQAEVIDEKMLVFPPTNTIIEAYDWGYWSLAPISSLLTNASILNKSGMSYSEKDMVDQMYYMIKRDDRDWIKLARFMDIQYFIVRNDFQWDLPSSPTDNPDVYQQIFENTPDLKLIKQFGKWSVFEFNSREKHDNGYAVNKLNFFEGSVSDLRYLLSHASIDPYSVVYVSETQSQNTERLLQSASSIAISPYCKICTLRFPFVDEGSFVPTLTADSVLYPILQQREVEKEKSLSASGSERIRYYLRRSMEDQKGVERIIDEKKSSDAVTAGLEQYFDSLKKLNLTLEQTIKNDPLEHNDLLIESYTYLYSQNKNIIGKFPLITGEVDPKLVSSVVALADETMRLLKENVWVTENLIEKKYTFRVPEEGDYDIFLKGDSLSENIAGARNIRYALNDEQSQIDALLENGWYNLGEVNLKTGMQKIMLEDSPQRNVFPVENSSFSLLDTAGKSHSCYQSPTIATDTGAVYNISLEYRQLQGSAKYYFYPLHSKEKLPTLTKLGTDFKNTLNWEKMVTDYKAIDDDGFSFYICSRTEVDRSKRDSILEARDIKVYKVTEPKILLLKNKKQNVKDTTEIGMEKRSQTDYLVSSDQNLKESIILFNQSYNNNWVLKGSVGEKFTANGFANAWFITSDSNVATISYHSQRYVKLGFIITGLTLISIIGILIYMKVSQHEKN